MTGQVQVHPVLNSWSVPPSLAGVSRGLLISQLSQISLETILTHHKGAHASVPAVREDESEPQQPVLVTFHLLLSPVGIKCTAHASEIAYLGLGILRIGSGCSLLRPIIQ